MSAMRVILLEGSTYVSVVDLVSEKVITPEKGASIVKEFENRSTIINIIDDKIFTSIVKGAISPDLIPKDENDCDCDCAQEC